jgi:protein O-GlcNAc transferase
VDVHGLDARTAAQRIARDEIDVLVDLGGYAGGSPIDVLACRPAPVQGHFLGYPGTTGAPFVDFFVADEVTVPHGTESTFTEKVLRMPRCCQPNDPKLAIPSRPRRADVGLPEDAVVLCSFNQPVKLRPAVFEDWCRMLAAIPRAVLWLRDPGASARARLQSFAAARGIDVARIVFAAHKPRSAHLERLASADLALDPFPYGSHTTASDALWAGVPLVTRRGETFASRVGASLLDAAGLGDWAFDDPRAGYERVVSMASDGKRLAEARERVEAARASALFDSTAFARDFESLLLAAARPARL